MLEAKDTIIKDNTIIKISEKGKFTRGGVGITASVFKNQCVSNRNHKSVGDNIETLLIAQAEISFKGGKASAYDRAFIKGQSDGLVTGKRQGIKEVVGFVEDKLPKTLGNYIGFWQSWQDKLKDWGVEND